MGLDWTGRLALARAHAFASLSEWGHADAAAAAAVAHEPDLTQEAAGIRAAAALCRGLDGTGHRARNRKRNEPSPDPGQQGEEHHLRNLPIPALPKNGAGEAPFWRTFADDLQPELLDNLQAQNERLAAINASRNAAQPAARRRRQGLAARVVNASQASDVEALRMASRERLDESLDVFFDFFGDAGDTRYRQFLAEAEELCEGSDEYRHQLRRRRAVPVRRLKRAEPIILRSPRSDGAG